MSMKKALRARLLGATAAGSKVHWLTRPQEDALPAITLQTAGGDRPRTYGGLQGWRETRVQFDAWASSTDIAEQILDAAITTLEPKGNYGGIFFDTMSFEGERDGTETLGSKTIYRTGIDLIVRHAPA